MRIGTLKQLRNLLITYGVNPDSVITVFREKDATLPKDGYPNFGISLPWIDVIIPKALLERLSDAALSSLHVALIRDYAKVSLGDNENFLVYTLGFELPKKPKISYAVGSLVSYREMFATDDTKYCVGIIEDVSTDSGSLDYSIDGVAWYSHVHIHGQVNEPTQSSVDWVVRKNY